MKQVYVVTGKDLGWDCVVGVFDADKVSKDSLLENFPREGYVIFSQEVETNLDNW